MSSRKISTNSTKNEYAFTPIVWVLKRINIIEKQVEITFIFNLQSDAFARICLYETKNLNLRIWEAIDPESEYI